MRFGGPRVRALLTALLSFRVLPDGFQNRDLRDTVAADRVAHDGVQARPHDLRSAPPATARLHGPHPFHETLPRHRRRPAHWAVLPPNLRLACCGLRTLSPSTRPLDPSPGSTAPSNLSTTTSGDCGRDRFSQPKCSSSVNLNPAQGFQRRSAPDRRVAVRPVSARGRRTSLSHPEHPARPGRATTSVAPTPSRQRMEFPLAQAWRWRRRKLGSIVKMGPAQERQRGYAPSSGGSVRGHATAERRIADEDVRAPSRAEGVRF